VHNHKKIQFSPKNRTFPEVDKWDLSEFVVKTLVNIVGVKPFPLDELLFMCSSVAYFNPDIIIEWGTHVGKSARVFYETVKHLGIKTEIHSIDLPPDTDHIENIKDREQRGLFVRGLPVNLHLGDGLEIALKIMREREFNFPLFFVDGDHSFASVWRELNGIKEITDRAAILTHDTFYQGIESNYNIGPFQAVNQFSEENDICTWSTNLGLPGMSLLWLGGPSSKQARFDILHRTKELHISPNKIKDLKKPNKQTKSKKLSILHTVEFYHPHVGGAETVVQQISERLAKRGHHVEIATTKLPDRNFQELNGVIIHEFDIAGNLTTGFRGTDIQRYRDFLHNHPANVAMNYAAQQWATDLAFSALEKTKGSRINIIAPCGYSALQDARTIRWPQFSDYFNKIIPMTIPLYDAAIYHSSMYKDYEFATLHGFQNSVVIPNGVDEEEFLRGPLINFREKYNITTQYMGLCVANFYRDKGHDRIIEAVRQMNRSDFSMVFIGKDGSELIELQRHAQGLNVYFLVNIPREDTVAAYHTADIFLFGSYIEASPLVIIEAKASKTPFVSTDCGNVKEWQGGIVCSPEEIADNANRLLDNDSARKQLAEEGYREWKEKLTWEAIVDQYEDLYLRLHSAKSRKIPQAREITVGTTTSEEIPSLHELKKDFRNISALIRLAEIEMKRANHIKARNYLIAARAVDPDNAEVKALLNILQT
jgi:L-malate glycosyltransferase